MRMRLVILLFIALGSLPAYTQLFFPHESYYNGEIDRFRLRADSSISHYQTHLSMKPVMETIAIRDSVLFDGSKQYYWITQKLFKENFIIFTNGDDQDPGDFWCSIDPILDVEGGSDLSADSLRLLYWNTRGIRVQARIMDKVAFTTSVYETQSVQAEYYSDFVTRHGEFYPSSVPNQYNQQNGVVPGYGRVKLFKADGLDYTMASSILSIRANKHFNVSLGQSNHFIGNGQRSLLLSDFSSPFPFVNFRTTFWNGRIQYNAMYSIHQNLYRLREFSTPEATYERKLGAHQYLDVSVTKNWQIGLFYGSLWNRVDSTGMQALNYLYFNPLILSNALVNTNSMGRNQITGLNTNIAFGMTNFYGQLVLQEDFSMGGFQFGFRSYDLLVPKLDVQVEYNQVLQNTYLSNEDRMNWSSNNLPLAHPLTAGFRELIAAISYQHNRFFVTNRLTYSARDRNDDFQIGTEILEAKGELLFPPGFYQNHVVMNQLEIGYRFNKQNNLQLFMGHTYRNETVYTNRPTTNYVFAGIRTRLNNKTQNF